MRLLHIAALGIALLALGTAAGIAPLDAIEHIAADFTKDLWVHVYILGAILVIYAAVQAARSK